MKKVYIVSAKRTPMGSFGGALSNIEVSQLGATAIKAALSGGKVPSDVIDEVFMGNVLQAGVGQAPARQAAIKGGLSQNTPCTTINKVCASGMKAIQFGAQSIQLGQNNLVVVGGMENMSRVPHYLQGRTGQKLGDLKAVDGLILDGLTDVYDGMHMGVSAEKCAVDYNISREEQDQYAINSYQRSATAWEKGLFKEEITPVTIPQRKGDDIQLDTDEEYEKVKFEKIPSLRPVFKKDGTVTAANASTLNDGAAALILASEEAVEKHQLTPIAEIIAYADAAKAPDEFTTAPADAIPLALQRAQLKDEDVDFWEINEAFSVVSLANCQLLNLDTNKVNVNGGAVSLGHPLGCSGARIVVSLIHILKQQNAFIGVAGICNGGGGASAMVIKRV